MHVIGEWIVFIAFVTWPGVFILMWLYAQRKKHRLIEQWADAVVNLAADMNVNGYEEVSERFVEQAEQYHKALYGW